MAAVLVLVGASASAAPVAEDVAFGCGLVRKKFRTLGIQVLERVANRLETKEQKRAVYESLLEAHEHLSRLTYTFLNEAEAKKRREYHRAQAKKYRARLSKLGAVREAGDFDRLLKLRGEAQALAHEIAAASSAERKEQLRREMAAKFEAVIRGLGLLAQKAAAAIQEHDKKEPDAERRRTAHKRWVERRYELLAPHMRSVIELNITRYLYAVALHPKTAADKTKRQELLKTAIDQLENYCLEYDQWIYAIYGQLYLSKAYVASRQYDEAKRTCESALLLIKDFLENNPRNPDLQRSLHDLRSRHIAAWALACAKLGQYAEAVKKLGQFDRKSQSPEVRLALGEVLLAWGQSLKQKAATRATGEEKAKQGRGLLEAVAAADGRYAARVRKLLERYGVVGSGYATVLGQLENAWRRRDNAQIIQSGLHLLAFGDGVPPDKRALALKLLALAFRQRQMFYEAHTVAKALATSPLGGEQKSAYADLAVVVLQQQCKETQDPADRAILRRVKRWHRDTFGGPGKEYADGLDLMRAKKYLLAARKFEQVPKTSLYHEAALAKRGECYVVEARRIAKTAPRRAEELRAKGRAALLAFLQLAAKPSIHPKVRQQRQALLPAVVYRLASTDIWKGKEDYPAYLRRTEGYLEKYKDAPQYHPYVLFHRVRALVATGRRADAENEWLRLKDVAAKMKARAVGAKMVSIAGDILFEAYAKRGDALRAEAKKKKALAAAEKDPAKARKLLDEAEEKEAEADEEVRKALRIATDSLAAQREASYSRLYYILYEYTRLREYQSAAPYIKQFLDRFANVKDLPPQRRKQVEGARLLLVVAYYHSGRYEEAYQAAAELYKHVNKQTHPSEYWQVKRYLAKSATQLAESGDKKYIPIARKHLGELYKAFRPYTADWWDVAASLAELRKLSGLHDINLLVIDRLVTTRPDLGGATVRARYFRVCRSVFENPKLPRDLRDKALELLVRMRVADIRELRSKKRYQEIAELVRDFRAISVNYGSRENRERLRAVLEETARAANDPKAKRELLAVAKELKK